MDSACACVQLLRVGVDVFRYVAVSDAVLCWLITIDKNIKGRSHKPAESEVVYFIINSNSECVLHEVH